MSVEKDDLIICRCEEITLEEIRQAVRDGATDVTGIKRRTRAGMGLCQGRTCELLVQRILSEELSTRMADLPPATSRPPARPVSFRKLGGTESE